MLQKKDYDSRNHTLCENKITALNNELELTKT